MDPRSRLYEGAHGSPLYTAPRKNINPSTSGGHIQEEIAEVSKWVNYHLALAGHSDQLVTDLPTDMADGITLLRLVQALSKEELPKHFPNPIMRVQKLENLQMCVRFLQEKSIALKGIHANDITSGNVKTILAMCHALKKHFTMGTSPKIGTSVSVVQSAATTASSVPHHSTRLSFSSLDREDMALLGWLGDIVHRDLSNYSMLYDGKVLCDFANEIKEESISEQVTFLKGSSGYGCQCQHTDNHIYKLITIASRVFRGEIREREDIISGTPRERLQIAFMTIEKLLFVRPGGIDVAKVGSGLEDLKLRRYLGNCREVFKQRVSRQQRKGGRAGGRGRSLERNAVPSMEEVFESLRTSKGSPSSSLEQREAAKIEARSLEGLRQKKLSSTSPQGDVERRKAEEKEVQKPKEKKRSVGKREEQVESKPRGSSGPTHSTSSRLSSSTENLPSSSRPTQRSLSTGTRGTLHSSHDRLSSTRHSSHLPLSRPFTDIYVSGEPSFSTSHSKDHQPLLRFNSMSNELLNSPENWELDTSPTSLSQDFSLSQPQGSSFLQPRISPLSPSKAASHGLSRSMDGRLGPLRQSSLPVTPTLHHSHPDGRKSGYGSDQDGPSQSSVPKSSASRSSSTLPRTKKPNQSPPSSPSSSSPTSPTPPPLPTVPPPSTTILNKSLSRPSEVLNQPTFVPPGRKFPRKLPSYTPPESDNLAAQIGDLQDQISLLSTQLLHEKADVYTRLHRAVIRERKKRQAVEKRLREMEKATGELVRHYDSCLIQVVKEVGELREQILTDTHGDPSNTGRGPGARNRHYITKEIDELREEVSRLSKKMETTAESAARSSSVQGRPKEALFMRKRANSDSSGPFLKGSTTSFKKLSHFFGEDPPRLEDMETFLEGLGYSHLYPTFSAHQISLSELYQMDETHLEVLGIPLGPRVRIMAEVRSLEPLDKHSGII